MKAYSRAERVLLGSIRTGCITVRIVIQGVGFARVNSLGAPPAVYAAPPNSHLTGTGRVVVPPASLHRMETTVAVQVAPHAHQTRIAPLVPMALLRPRASAAVSGLWYPAYALHVVLWITGAGPRVSRVRVQPQTAQRAPISLQNVLHARLPTSYKQINLAVVQAVRLTRAPYVRLLSPAPQVSITMETKTA